MLLLFVGQSKRLSVELQIDQSDTQKNDSTPLTVTNSMTTTNTVGTTHINETDSNERRLNADKTSEQNNSSSPVGDENHMNENLSDLGEELLNSCGNDNNKNEIAATNGTHSTASQHVAIVQPNSNQLNELSTSESSKQTDKSVGVPDVNQTSGLDLFEHADELFASGKYH